MKYVCLLDYMYVYGGAYVHVILSACNNVFYFMKFVYANFNVLIVYPELCRMKGAPVGISVYCLDVFIFMYEIYSYIVPFIYLY